MFNLERVIQNSLRGLRGCLADTENLKTNNINRPSSGKLNIIFLYTCLRSRGVLVYVNIALNITSSLLRFPSPRHEFVAPSAVIGGLVQIFLMWGSRG
jgi:hypothetical protein